MKYLSEAERDLAKLAELEVEDPSLQDASITISYQELVGRTDVKMCDDMAYKFPKDELYPQIVACQKFYLALLLAGADNSATFDWETKNWILKCVKQSSITLPNIQMQKVPKH